MLVVYMLVLKHFLAVEKATGTVLWIALSMYLCIYVGLITGSRHSGKLPSRNGW